MRPERPDEARRCERIELRCERGVELLQLLARGARWPRLQRFAVRHGGVLRLVLRFLDHAEVEQRRAARIAGRKLLVVGC
jgi:hypothetical protein